MVPAMGVPAAFYARFAERLGEAGAAVRVLELPGQGASALRARRGDDWGYREIVEDVIPFAVRAARLDFPDRRIVLGGHSLGGQLSVLASGELAPLLDGLLLITAGTAHWRRWPDGGRPRARFLVHAISLVSSLLPWYPGDRLGFGGAQSRRFMRDWRHNARTGQYVLEGSLRSAQVQQSSLAKVALPVLALSIRGDAIAPEGAVSELLSHLPAAQVRRLEVAGHAAHSPWKRHFSWARAPSDADAAVLDWLAREPAAPLPFSKASDDLAAVADARDPAVLPVA